MTEPDTAAPHGPARPAAPGPPPAALSENTAPSENEVLTHTLRGLWPSLPALLAASVALCLAGTLTVLVLPGLSPLSAVLGAALAGPGGAALLATVGDIASTGQATVRTWWLKLRTLWGFGVRNSLPVGAVLAAFLGALAVWQRTSAVWALPSLGLSGACTVLGSLGMPAVLALGAARPGLRGRLLWICALHLVARSPLRFLAGPSVALLGVWAATAWSASLLLLVPAPAAVVMSAAVWTSTVRLGHHPAGTDRESAADWPASGPDRP